MTLKRALPLAFAIALTLPCSLVAQDLASYAVTQAIDTPQCSGGIVVDDGSFEAAYGIGDGQPGSAIMVQETVIDTATSLDQACVCFTRAESAPGAEDIPFDVVLYDNDGASGEPGTFLGSVNAIATAVPIFPAVKLYGVDLRNSGITLPGGHVFVGARWGGGASHLLCGDRSVSTLERNTRLSGDHGATWPSLSSVFPTTAPRALGIRVDPPGATLACVANDTTLCINDGRYAVTVQWETNLGTQGAGHAVDLTIDTGYFWFFDANNVELVVKVLDACSLSSRYWVFAGGLTNVRVILQVLDTQSGALRTYVNPQVTAFEPIQDTDAFATCP